MWTTLTLAAPLYPAVAVSSRPYGSQPVPVLGLCGPGWLSPTLAPFQLLHPVWG